VYPWYTLKPFLWQSNVPFEDYPITLANSTLIILFSEMLKLSKIISSKSKSIVKKNSEYLKNFIS
jgi:hypothetical protein